MARARGSLRVLLGAAPGVGKTYAMLKEGRRLQAEGKDVVIALLETHGRKATERAAEGLERVPRQRIRYRGMWLEEMDLFAIIERNPQVALVDELAHTNAPGSMHEKRWQDVEDLLDAGIDVITTINVQHIESLNDVVRDITGSEQRETVPDKVLRSARRVELVDLPPEGLRERLSKGLVYKSDRVDAALSNYFRVGNLTALRELALLWLAGRVDETLKEYRDEHHISSKWETRERVVVALSGGPEGEQLLRRGARVARASGGGDLIAVHVTSEDALQASSHQDHLKGQRELVEKLGGTYHQIVGEDIPDALLSFARANNATQIIIGVSRRSPIARLLGRSSATNETIEKSGDIDVHVVTHSYANKRGLRFRRFERTVSVHRVAWGVLFECAAVPLLALFLLQIGASVDAASASRDALLFQLVVILGALIGGMLPSVFGAVLAGFALDFMYISPVGTFHMPRWQDWMTMGLYVVVGTVVAMIVDQAAERTRQARRASAESETLASVADAALRSTDPLRAVVERTREAFGFTCVRIVHHGEIVVSDGPMPDSGKPDTIAIDKDYTLEMYGKVIDAADQRLLRAIITQIQSVLEYRSLERKAKEVEPLAAAEKIRTALLNAVSHDLRRPIASATAAVSCLQRMGDTMSETDRRELLGVANESLGQLSRLVADLLDVSRLREGALPLSMIATDVGEAIVPSLDELHIGPARIDLDLDPELPLVVADPPLLRRALANVLINAMRYTPDGKRVRISASAFNHHVEIRISDHGPGVPDDRKADIFVPFHRLGDTDNTTGLGLGMALSKGFVESMGGSIEAEDTPGGGLTMVITLLEADPKLRLGQPIPHDEIPDPTDRLEKDTLRMSDAVSDVILPLEGSGTSDRRGLDRFLRDDTATDGITPAVTEPVTTTTDRAPVASASASADAADAASGAEKGTTA